MCADNFNWAISDLKTQSLPSIQPSQNVIVGLYLVSMKAGGWLHQVVNWWHVSLVGTRHQVEPASLNPCRCEPCGSTLSTFSGALGFLQKTVAAA